MHLLSRFAIIVLVFGLGATVYGSQQGSVLERAQQEIEAGNFEAAIAVLTAEQRHSPESSGRLSLLALAEWKAGRLDKAIRDYRKALRIDPASFSVHYHLALLYLQQKDSASALPHLERAAQLDPGNADAQFNCAVVLIDAGRAADAVNYLLITRKLEPQRADVAFQMVRSHLAMNRVSEAKTEAASLVIDHPEAAGAIGQLFLNSGQPDVAVEYLHKAVNTKAGDEDSRYILAEALLAMSRSAEALTIIGDPISPFGRMLKVQALLGCGRLSDALKESEALLAFDPSNPEYLLVEGRLLQLNNDAAANRLFERALAADPTWFEPFYSLAVSFYLQQNYSSAIARLSQAIQRNSRCARCFFLRGISYFNQGELAPAKSDLQRAVALQPRNARFHTHLAVLLFHAGEVPAAESGFRSAILLDPAYGLPHYELGKLLAGNSRLSEAARQFELAYNCNPSLSQALYQLGLVFNKLGKREEASWAFEQFRRQGQNREEDHTILQNDFKPSLLELPQVGNHER